MFHNYIQITKTRVFAWCCLVSVSLSSCANLSTIQEIASQSVPAEQTKAVEYSCCAKNKQEKKLTPVVSTPKITTSIKLNIPDIELVNQDGEKVLFYSDLVKNKSVAIANFFTSCTTVCPTLTATMANVQQSLIKQGRDDIQLISISVDPITDTPKRLKAWSKNFSAHPGWVFLTGKKRNIDQLLKSLRSFTPNPEDHSPMILVGNEPKGIWKQVYGLTAASSLLDSILEVAGPKIKTEPLTITKVPDKVVVDSHSTENEAAHHYFTDLELVDQNGDSKRLYTDLMQGKVLVVNSFFSTCKGVCPIMNNKLADIYKAFPGRVGKDLFLLSISVDPLNDTPTRLGEYAKSLHTGPGWSFLTGTKENVDAALHKFGMSVESRENHSNLFMVGNDTTGLWKKAFGLAQSSDIVTIVDSVLNDQGEAAN